MCVWEPPRLLQGLEEAQAGGTTGQQRPEERKGRARSSHSKSLEASWYPPQNRAIKVTDQPSGYSPLFDPAPPPNGCPHKMQGHRQASSLRRYGFHHLWYRFSVPSFPSIPGVDQPQPSIKHSPPGDKDLWSCSLHPYLGSRKTLVWVTDWHSPLGRNGTSRLAWVRGWGPAGDLWSHGPALSSPAPRLDARLPRPTARWPFRFTQRRQEQDGHRGHGEDSGQRAGPGKRELGILGPHVPSVPQIQKLQASAPHFLIFLQNGCALESPFGDSEFLTW